MRTALIIPTRNGAAFLDRLLPALACQTLQPDEFLVVDSSSSDDTVARLRDFGARVEVIEPRQFNHGGTRRWASERVDAEVLIYQTQDAIPARPDSFECLRAALLAEDDIGIAYGRQLPHPNAGLLGAQARRFNYPPVSRTKRLRDAAELGIKTCFSSDSFAAYRRSALREVGGFPRDVIGSEDAYVAAKMLLAGKAIRYAADAQVQHSHDYRLMEEFRRYFDIGVFYGRERWIRQAFGSAGGEGKRYVLAELAALREAGALHRMPESLLRSALKLLGYRLGQLEGRLPTTLKRRISMFPAYWS
jgi:rhamnosyltransferase